MSNLSDNANLSFLYEALDKLFAHIPKLESPICPDENGGNWTIEDLDRYTDFFKKLSDKEGFNLTYYPIENEIVTPDEMNDILSFVAMPSGYKHWSFGLEYLKAKEQYRKGQRGQPYEVVINSSPCKGYLQNDNPNWMQALVIAHAMYGHNSFFAMNYMFTDWTDAEFIRPYLLYAKQYMDRVEEVVGEDSLQAFIDSLHAIKQQSVFTNTHRIKRDTESHLKKLQEMKKEITTEAQRHYDPVLDSKLFNNIPKTPKQQTLAEKGVDLEKDGENLLYVIEKTSNNFKRCQKIAGGYWKEEVSRIVRTIAQYFFPQMQTQVMNEGWASFTHYCYAYVAHQKGAITDKQYASILDSHTGVVFQPDYNSPHYSGINPYTLGINSMIDLLFACVADPESDRDRHRYKNGKYAEVFKGKEYYKDGKSYPILGCGDDWPIALQYIIRNFRDESFIRDFLSFNTVVKMGLFSHRSNKDDDNKETMDTDLISGIQDWESFEEVRRVLANNKELYNLLPSIAITGVDLYSETHNDATISLTHTSHDGSTLDAETAGEVLKHIFALYSGHEADGENRFSNINITLETVDVRTGEVIAQGGVSEFDEAYYHITGIYDE